MARTADIFARVEPEVKEQAEQELAKEAPTSKSVRFKWGEYVIWFRWRPEPVRYLQSGRFYPPDHRKYG